MAIEFQCFRVGIDGYSCWTVVSQGFLQRFPVIAFNSSVTVNFCSCFQTFSLAITFLKMKYKSISLILGVVTPEVERALTFVEILLYLP